MVHSRFDTEQFRRFATRLSEARTPRDLTPAKKWLGSESYGIRALVSLPVKDPSYAPFELPAYLLRDCIVPYFQHRYLYFIHHEIIQLPRLKVDHTVTFDTNFATYVQTIVRQKSIESKDQRVKEAFHNLLTHDINFDLFFYFVENIKVTYQRLPKGNERSNSPLSFWKALNRNFRWNIVCIELFRNVDCQHYRDTSTLKFDVSFIQAVRLAVQYTSGFYTSNEGRLLINDLLLPMHDLMLFQLLAMLRIQFSSNKSAKHKLGQFLSFVQDNGLPFLDRETVLACMYFKYRKETPYLHQINKGGNQDVLWEKINNMAWDLSAVRYMERMFAVLELGDYMIPFFFSFDKKLRDFIAAFPAKAVIIDRLSGGVISIPARNTNQYFEEHGFSNIVADFFSVEKTSERSRRIRENPNIPPDKMAEQYELLRGVLVSPN